MQRPLKSMYATIALNLLLWLALFGQAMSGRTDMMKPLAVAGLVFAALFQHWAYYSLKNSPAVRSNAAQ